MPAAVLQSGDLVEGEVYRVVPGGFAPAPADPCAEWERTSLITIGELTCRIRAAEDAGIPNTREYVRLNDVRHALIDKVLAFRAGPIGKETT